MKFDDAMMFKIYHVLNNKETRKAFIETIGDANATKLFDAIREDFEAPRQALKKALAGTKYNTNEAIQLLMSHNAVHVPSIEVVDSVLAPSREPEQEYEWMGNRFKLTGKPSYKLENDLKDYSVIYGTNPDGDGFDLTKKYLVQRGYARPVGEMKKGPHGAFLTYRNNLNG